MQNYKEETLPTKYWIRAFQMIVDNQYNKMPVVTWLEEKGADDMLGNPDSVKFSAAPAPYPRVTYTPGKVFKILNPEDNTDTGTTMTHDQFFAIMYSLWYDAAVTRDATIAAGLDYAGS